MKYLHGSEDKGLTCYKEKTPHTWKHLGGKHKLDFYIPCTSPIYAKIMEPTAYVLGIILLPPFENINDCTIQNDGEVTGQNLQAFCLAMAFPKTMFYLEYHILLRTE